jgi:hypothetical protein
MEIGIIGSGVVGQQLGFGLLKLGHEVKIGTRNPQKLDEWLKTAGKGASVGSFLEAAQFGSVIILATLWEGSADAIGLAGPEHFSGKIVLDVTNPLDFSKGAPPRLDSAPGKSGAERIHEHIPNAKLAKAFNHISAHIMISPAREEGVPDLFVAGDPEAKAFATEIALAWGWNSVIDMGDLSQAYLLEAYAMLWIQYAFNTGTWVHAFKFLRK